jgi:hypothetical protein
MTPGDIGTLTEVRLGLALNYRQIKWGKIRASNTVCLIFFAIRIWRVLGRQTTWETRVGIPRRTWTGMKIATRSHWWWSVGQVRWEGRRAKAHPALTTETSWTGAANPRLLVRERKRCSARATFEKPIRRWPAVNPAPFFFSHPSTQSLALFNTFQARPNQRKPHKKHCLLFKKNPPDNSSSVHPTRG